MHKYYLLAITAVFAFMSVSFAGPVNASLGGFLRGFIGNANASIAYSNPSFAIVLVNGSYIAVGLSPYSMVTNYTESYDDFKAFVLHNSSFNTSLVTNLTAKVDALYRGSRGSFAQCFTYTGLNSTYLQQNSSQGCASVSICSDYLANSTLSPSVQTGIVNLSKQYNVLNQSYNGFNAIVGKVTAGNYYEYADQLASYAEKIGDVPFNLMHNPLFGVPGNFSTGLYKNCPYFPSAGTLQSFPWYCQMLNICQVGFNYANATSIQAAAQQLQALPSNSTISGDAARAVSLANSYILSSSAGNATIFNDYINSTASISRNATSLSAKVANASLLGLLYQLNLTIRNVKASYYANLAGAKRNVSAVLAQMANLTSELRARYYSAYNLSVGNAALLAAKELDSPGSPAVAQLAGQQTAMQALFGNVIPSGALAGITANVTALRSSIGALGEPLSLGAFVKSADSWFMDPIVSSLAEPLQARIAATPLYAALLSLIIGGIIVLIVYKFTYYGLNKGKRIKRSRPVKKAWGYLFIVLIILALVYAGVTYAVASGANGYLPLSGFMAQLSGSRSAVIAVDSGLSGNASITACVASLQAGLAAQHKNVSTVTESGYQCSGAASPDCLDTYAASGTPVVLVNATGQSGYRGLYGYMLYSNESYAAGANCRLAQLFK